MPHAKPEFSAVQEWFYMPMDMRETASRIGVGQSGLECSKYSWKLWQGGNQWSGSTAFLAFFRHVVKLDLDYSKWAHWEDLTMHAGPRIVHEQYCIISDRPEELYVDDRFRPHNDNGPFCRWRDGSSLYCVHGVRVPGWIVEYPERIDVASIDKEANAEVRRVMCEKYGWERFLADAKCEKIDHDDARGTLYRRKMKQGDPVLLLQVVNSSPEPDGSYRLYTIPVHHELRPLPDLTEDPNARLGEPQALTSHNAVASTFGLRGEEYHPEAET
jgi:hypothetical protein